MAEDRPQTGKASTFQTAFNLFKVFLGIGILATPASFQSIGLVGGFLGLVFVGVLNTYTMKLQIAAKLQCKGAISSYSDLGGAVLGTHGK